MKGKLPSSKSSERMRQLIGEFQRYYDDAAFRGLPIEMINENIKAAEERFEKHRLTVGDTCTLSEFCRFFWQEWYGCLTCVYVIDGNPYVVGSPETHIREVGKPVPCYLFKIADRMVYVPSTRDEVNQFLRLGILDAAELMCVEKGCASPVRSVMSWTGRPSSELVRLTPS